MAKKKLGKSKSKKTKKSSYIDNHDYSIIFTWMTIGTLILLNGLSMSMYAKLSLNLIYAIIIAAIGAITISASIDLYKHKRWAYYTIFAMSILIIPISLILYYIYIGLIFIALSIYTIFIINRKDFKERYI